MESLEFTQTTKSMEAEACFGRNAIERLRASPLPEIGVWQRVVHQVLVRTAATFFHVAQSRQTRPDLTCQICLAQQRMPSPTGPADSESKSMGPSSSSVRGLEADVSDPRNIVLCDAHRLLIERPRRELVGRKVDTSLELPTRQ